MITYYVFFYILGSFVGAVFTAVWLSIKKPLIGSLRIDKSDIYDGPHLFLELDKGIHEIVNRKYVLLKVRDENLLPRE